MKAPKMAKNCPASWARMHGDGRVRHCTHCDRKVYNLSEMPEAEAQAFVRETEGRECIRYYQRADGTVMTRDCGLVERTRIRVKASVVGMLTLIGVACAPVTYAGQPRELSTETQIRISLKQVRLYTEMLQEEKDPEARKDLIGLRRKEYEKAMALTKRQAERG